MLSGAKRMEEPTWPMLKTSLFHPIYRRILVQPVARAFLRIGLKATHASSAAVGVAAAAAFCFAFNTLWGGVAVLISGYFDTLDGEMARIKGSGLRAGAFLDSILDRYADFIIVFGILIHYYRISALDITVMIVILFVVFGSLMENYAQIKAESLNTSCSIGFWERPERLILLGLAGILEGFIQTAVNWISAPAIFRGGIVLGTALLLIAAGTNWMCLRRLRYGFDRIRKQEQYAPDSNGE
jgi:CDP-diacylglycerol--glycerol-3-phosphate 3-phosphatidyltransferase